MVKYVKRQDLNVAKYNECVKNSCKSNVYGFSWYLDIVANSWDALVYKNYEAVMPIFYQKKMGLKYSLQPFFCQKINIYTHLKLHKNIINLFLKGIPKNILILNVNLSFNPQINSVIQKDNYHLSLQNSYKNIYSNYRKDRKKSLAKALKNNLSFSNSTSSITLINIYKQVFAHLSHSKKYFSKIQAIMAYCLQNNNGFIRNVFLNNTLICSGFFLVHDFKIYYLFGASTKIGRNSGATTFLIDSVIKEYADTNYIFDFEGSTIPNVGSFYKSFGSQKTTYYNLKTNVFQRIFF